MHRSGYHLSQSDRAHIRALYESGLNVMEVAARTGVSRETVGRVTAPIRRSKGWRDGACACGPAGWSPIQEQLDRRKLLDDAKAGEPIALRRLNAMGVLRWERGGEVVVGECHV